MYDEALNELTKLAAAHGLRVEVEGDEYLLFRGENYLESLWYIEEYAGWTNVEPGSEPLEHILGGLMPTKKRVRREVSYTLTFSYGRRKAPDRVAEGVTEKVLAAAVKLAKTVSPGAVSVSVWSMHQPKAKSIKLL